MRLERNGSLLGLLSPCPQPRSAVAATRAAPWTTGPSSLPLFFEVFRNLSHAFLQAKVLLWFALCAVFTPAFCVAASYEALLWAAFQNAVRHDFQEGSSKVVG
jgi:hypothetical protein